MKKITLLFCLLTIPFFHSIAQTVTIPDANFVKWLTATIPSAMNGDQLDTSSVAVKTLKRIDVEDKGIIDLTAAKYFPALITLDCGNGLLGSTTPNKVTQLPALSKNLDTLICGGNQLINLPDLPSSLRVLKCYNNKLTSLPALPQSLIFLDCHTNALDSLPTLPAFLNYLDCSDNHLANLPGLPSSLSYLYCGLDNLTTLPVLPNSLLELACGLNSLKNLPTLPNSIIFLECSNNMLDSLPALPAALEHLDCSDNQLTNMPVFSNSLIYIDCSGNQLIGLPSLPGGLGYLRCEKNQLTTLPTLPNTLLSLGCSSNKITCFPVFPTSLTTQTNFSIFDNPFSCLPNYVAAMDPSILAFPLCNAGDSLSNPHACPGAAGIVGFTYRDLNGNCTKNNTDHTLINVHELLYNGSTLLNQTYSAINGIYNFPESTGTYTVKIDTVNVPFAAQCAQPGIDSAITLTAGNPLVNNVNFNLTCKPGFDIGTKSAIISGWVFPGLQHGLHIIAGDLSHWYHLNCASGVSGHVQITVNGPVTYTGIVPGALTPAVSGKTFIYTIADFGTIDLYNDFGLLFLTDTTAKVGDWVCVNISVTPGSGDNTISNNTFKFCYQVINSHDPNKKEVYPTDVEPGYHDWFNYTIHFQNTGNAAAHNIRLVDTLDTNLDLSTFQLINYSHKNTVSFEKNELTFRFPNIMLADSISDEEGSKGYVQYRIKPKAGLPAGTQIKNTANIYFDYNPAVVTNTTINNFKINTSVKENQSVTKITVYPNPGTGIYNIRLPENSNRPSTTIKVYNVIGELVYETQTQNKTAQIDLSNQPKGVYVFRVDDGKQFFNQIVVKQ